MKRILLAILAVIFLNGVVTHGPTMGDEPQLRSQAIATLREHGVKVTVTDTFDRQSTRIFFGCHRGSAPLVRQLQHVSETQEMNLRLARGVTSDDLKGLRSLSKLNDLVIHNCLFDEQALTHIATLGNLRKLRLASVSITDAGLKHLANMKNLEQLWVSGKAITDEGVVHLEQLTNLKDLRVKGTSVTKKRLAELQALLPNTKIEHYD